jgi:glucose/arabinose dehydrogenase
VRHVLPRVVSLTVLALACAASSAFAVTSLPTYFSVENAVPGVTFQVPTCVAFLPDGRMLVGEKRGVVWVVSANGVRHPIPLWSREDEVEDRVDCGLMSIAVDPSFESNGRVYFLYTVDPDSNGVDDDWYVFGRLTRYTFSLVDSNALDPASRRILIGHAWPYGPLAADGSHTTGSLRWGEDGSLLVSIGEGGISGHVDAGGQYPDAFGAGKTPLSEDIGAFRAQDWDSPSGKILRINPASGAGYPSNPFYRPNDPYGDRSRVWAYGLRNPFRICVRPGTGNGSPSAGDPGTLLIGDVGWFEWEEIDVAATGGENFGWPCYEGVAEVPGYQAANPDHHDCSTIETSQNPSPHTPPRIAWNHADTSIAVPAGYGLSGNCAISGIFYDGDEYPPIFQGALFFADFGSNWMKIAKLDANNQIVQITDFGQNLYGPVDFAPHPTTGDIVYVAIGLGQVRRIRYDGPGGNAPLASATSSTLVGTAPLSVSFSAATSFSPIGRPLTYLWNFGDGATSAAVEPTHAFALPGEYTVVLTVTDDLAALGRDTLHLVVTSSSTTRFPSTPVIDDFDRPDGPIGGAWTDELYGLAIVDHRLRQTGGIGIAVWGGGAPFGPNQEAYFTLDAMTQGSPHHSLMLKVQGTSYANGHIQVRYKLPDDAIYVTTYAPSQGWVERGTIEYPLDPGDQLGARARPDGVIEVFVNGDLLGAIDGGNWPFHAGGGRIGLVLQDALSTRVNDFGGGDASGFPGTPVVDDFGRADGPIGNGWMDDLFGLVVADSQLTQTAGQAIAVWGGGPYGANQEAYFTLNDLTPNSPHHSLMLKIQGDTYTTGHIQVRYKLPDETIYVTTLAPGQGWVGQGWINVKLEPGDQLGARAYSNGLLQVYRNGYSIGLVDCSEWPFNASGGRIGLVLQDGVSTRIDDFGGGTSALGFNELPVPIIQSPLDGAFFAAGDTVHLVGAATDPDHDPGQLTLRWQVDQHHNNHVHPSVYTTNGATGQFVGEDHDDGTGTHLVVHLQVTDPRGGRDTAHVAIWPEVDLAPGALVTVPASPTTSAPAEYRFWIHNRGRMSAPISRWVLRLGSGLLAQGDTTVPALDSVLVVRTLGPVAGAGVYTLRAVVDSLDRVRETDPSNNGLARPLTIVNGAGADVLPPLFVEGPAIAAYGVTARVWWRTNEPAHGVVRYGTTPALGDSVPEPAHAYEHETLIGGLLPLTRYYWRVVAADTASNFRSTALDSFTTAVGPAGSDGDLPVRFAVSAARPTPTRAGVSFVAELPTSAVLRLAVYDLQGREISRVTPYVADAGRVLIRWSGLSSAGTRLPPGLYLARIELGERSFVRRVVVVQ